MSLTGAACGGDDDTSTDDSSQSGYSGSGGSGKAGSSGGGSSIPRAGTGGSKSTTGTAGSTAAAAGAKATAGASAAAGTTGSAGRVAANGGSGAPSTGAGGTTSGSAGNGAEQGVLTDAEIASVLSTANEGEVQQNMVALSKANAPEARALAQDLITMHQAAQTRLNTLLTSLNITAADNPVSQQLRSASLSIVTTLQDTTGAFDMTYLQSQIDAHIQVLSLIDQTLLPSAQNPQLRSELAVVRGEVVMHLQRARALAASLMLDVDAGTIDVDGGI